MTVANRTVIRVQVSRTASVPPRPVFWVSGALGLLATMSAALTFFFPGLLTGPDVTNGNARGTSLVILAAGIPILIGSMVLVTRGSWRAHVVWLGVVAYLTYNGFLFLFATPFNSLFLLYVATFSLGLFALGALIGATDPESISEKLPRLPIRFLSIYAWTAITLNALVWLRGIVPTIGDTNPGAVLEGSGVATNPIWIQDLAFWLPMAALAAWWLWRRRPWGYALAGAWLVYAVIESVGVAVDQWFGTAADPGTPHASIAGVAIFGVLALVGLIPLYIYFRRANAAPTRS